MLGSRCLGPSCFLPLTKFCVCSCARACARDERGQEYKLAWPEGLVHGGSRMGDREVTVPVKAMLHL